MLASVNGDYFPGALRPGCLTLAPPLLTACLKFVGNVFSSKRWRVKNKTKLNKTPKQKQQKPSFQAECWSPKNTFSLGFGGFIGMQQDCGDPHRDSWPAKDGLSRAWTSSHHHPTEIPKAYIFSFFFSTTACAWCGRPLFRLQDLQL